MVIGIKRRRDPGSEEGMLVNTPLRRDEATRAPGLTGGSYGRLYDDGISLTTLEPVLYQPLSSEVYRPS